MTTDLYHYQFAQNVPAEEIEATILLSLFTVESLHGEAQVRLDAAHHLDSDRRLCVLNAATAVGRDFNRLFVGFLRREFGEDSFQVERLAAAAAPRCQPTTPTAPPVTR